MLIQDKVRELLDRVPETFSLEFFIEQLLLLENEDSLKERENRDAGD